MTSNPRQTNESLRAIAEQGGLSLSDEELDRLRKGIERSQAWGKVVRGLLTPDVEPSSVFSAAPVGGPAGSESDRG